MEEEQEQPRPRIKREIALQIASELIERFQPTCPTKLEYGGSLRRGYATVKDVELMGISVMTTQEVGLFGDVEFVEAQWKLVNEMLAAGEIEKRLNKKGHPTFGKKMQYFTYKGFAVDFFVTYDPDRWGTLKLIRTGPYNFSRCCVTQVYKGGVLANEFNCEDNQIIHTASGQVFPTPEEEDVFQFLTIPFIEPSDRSQWIDDFERSRPKTKRA